MKNYYYYYYKDTEHMKNQNSDEKITIYNHENYLDPTSYFAIRNIESQLEKKKCLKTKIIDNEYEFISKGEKPCNK